MHSMDYQFAKLKYVESSVIYSKCEVSTQTNDIIEMATPENQDKKHRSKAETQKHMLKLKVSQLNSPI